MLLLFCCTKCLAELRDKIFCTADGMILGDHSDNPDQLSQSTAKVCIAGTLHSWFTTEIPSPLEHTHISPRNWTGFFFPEEARCMQTKKWKTTVIILLILCGALHYYHIFAFSLVDIVIHIFLYYYQDVFKSGFFFIEGVFYNDKRDPTSRDYSK